MNFKRIENYSNIAKLVEEQTDKNISPEIMYCLQHMNDFEPFNYMVVNNSFVVIYDILSGDVIEKENLDNYINQVLEYAAENI